MIGLELIGDNKLSREVLGMEYKYSKKESFIQMGYSLIEKGLVPDRRKKN